MGAWRARRQNADREVDNGECFFMLSIVRRFRVVM